MIFYRFSVDVLIFNDILIYVDQKIFYLELVMVKLNENTIREAAYYNWQNAGCPQGQDEYFWTMAMEQVANGCCGSCKSSKTSCTSSSAKKTVKSSSSTAKKSVK